MKKRRIVSALALVVLSTIGVNALAQPRNNDTTNRQVRSILQRLERTSNRFRSSLNLALINARIDETRPQNDINTFEPALSSAVDQFTDRFTHRLAAAVDVQNILQKAAPVHGFMSRNRLNPQVQNDWTAVRTDLNALANAYNVNWQWNQQDPLPMSPSRSLALSNGDLNQLIRRIAAGGDSFRSSLNAAFDLNSNNQPPSVRNILVAVGYFREATDQLRNQFDAKQRLADNVGQVLTRATPIDTYMSNNRLTTQAQTDWSTLRGDLNTLAGAYSVSTAWQAGPE